MTDFEKYPKYLLNKHGKVIQNILSNAETVFNMDADPGKNDDPVAIQIPLFGGENLRNEQDYAPIFEDAINLQVDSETGIQSVGVKKNKDGLELKMAIAEFATEDNILAMFPDMSFLEELLPEPAPSLTFSTDQIVLAQADSTTASGYLFELKEVSSEYKNVSSFTPNVMGNTGIEAKDIIKGIIKEII